MSRKAQKAWSRVFRRGKEDEKTSEVEAINSNDTSILPSTAPAASVEGQNPAQALVPNTSVSSVETAEDEADGRGLFTFVEKDRDESGIVDIVAIHGLNGHYSKTWSTSSVKGGRINWLKDMLPQRIPNARIMSFGYNANVQFSKSTADISDFVEGLLSDLVSCRTSQQEKTRPLIFICHSLGGIVFKQVSLFVYALPTH
jgi:hypothetical protein